MENRRRNKLIRFWLTDDEFAFFQKQMNLTGAKSRTDFILALLRKKEIIVVEDLRPTLVELKRHGSNLNQIARQINEGTDAGDEARRVLAECWTAYRALEQFAGVK